MGIQTVASQHKNLTTKCTKKEQGRSGRLFFPFVLFVPFVVKIPFFFLEGSEMKVLKTWLLALVLVCGVGGAASAAVPNLINYQGRLTDHAGNPVNGTVQIQFAIYGVATGGTALWSEA